MLLDAAVFTNHSWMIFIHNQYRIHEMAKIQYTTGQQTLPSEFE